MFKPIRRYFGRRKLAPVAGALPVWLAKNFAAQDHYTMRQVQRAAKELKLDDASLPIAFAACCTLDEFQRAFPQSAPADYATFRAQLTALFDIHKETFTCKDLRALKDVPASSRSSNPPGDSTGGGSSLGYD